MLLFPSSHFILLTHSPTPPFFFFFNDPPTTEIYTLSLHDALPIYPSPGHPHSIFRPRVPRTPTTTMFCLTRSEEHTSELQSRGHLVCRLLLEKKKKKNKKQKR